MGKDKLKRELKRREIARRKARNGREAWYIRHGIVEKILPVQAALNDLKNKETDALLGPTAPVPIKKKSLWEKLKGKLKHES